jgi:hypothetical protein
MGVDPGYADDPRVQDLVSRREELKSVGPPKDPHWWGAGPDGKRISMRDVVRALQTHEHYKPRLHGGDEPALRDTYALANKWANEELHHSPRGLPMWLLRDGLGDKPAREHVVQTASTVYWIFGQTATLQLTDWVTDASLGPRFEKLYFDLWPTVTGGVSLDEARADLARARAEFQSKSSQRGDSQAVGD